MSKLFIILVLSSCNLASADRMSASASLAPVVNPLPLASFNLSKSALLSVKLVDYAWANRENLANQQIIADYLLTQPEVPADYETAWKTARLVAFIGNYGLGEKKFMASASGVKLFDYGVVAAKVALKLKESGVEGQYWYASDLGSYGLAKGILSSASNAKSGMNALRLAIKIDPSYQWYGSSRILGRYYQELPRFLGGNPQEALALLQAASTKAPQFKNNWVFLGQYYNSVGDPQKARIACQKALTLPNQDGKFEEMRYMREAKECLDKAKAKIG